MRDLRDIEAGYFSWLLGHVENDRYKMDLREDLDNMLYVLYETVFLVDPRVPDDQNRVIDAYAFREIYLDQLFDEELPYDFVVREPSVLEVLVALSVRCEMDIMRDDDLGDRTGEWFWSMMDGLELVEIAENGGDILGRLDDFMCHKCGLFCDNLDLKSVKKESLWSQLCRFLDGKI